MKKALLSLCVLAVASLAFSAAKNYSGTLTEDKTWNDLWGGTPPTIDQDFDISLTKSDYKIIVGAGETVSSKGGRLLQYAGLQIGDDSGLGEAIFNMTGRLELQGAPYLIVKSNGVVNLSDTNSLTFYNASTDVDPYILVDGGKINGSISVGSTIGTGKATVTLRNGAVWTRNNQVNPGGMAGRADFTINNSTYNVFNGTNFGNWVFNSMPDNSSNPTEINLKIENGSVVNGAGVISGSTVAYYDFSTPISSTLASSGADVRWGMGRVAFDTDYVKVSILGGSKISGKSFLMVQTDGAAKSAYKGSYDFTIAGDSAEKMSMLAGTGFTNLGLTTSYDTSTTTRYDSTLKVAFNMSGYASYQTLGNFTAGSDDTLGGSLAFTIKGDKNDFTVANFYINGGKNNQAGLASNADMKFYFGNDGKGGIATNSTMTVNQLQIDAGANSDIYFRYSDASANNTLKINNNLSLNTSSFAGGESRTVFELTDGAKLVLSSGSLYFNNNGDRVSGYSEVIINSGTELTSNGISMNGSVLAGSTTESWVTLNGGKYTSKTDISASMGSSKYGIRMTGNDGVFTAEGQMNMNGGTPLSGGSFNIEMSGNNNTLYAKKNLNVNAVLTGTAAYNISLTGSGNKLIVGESGGSFSLGNSASTGGSYNFFSQSSSAINKNYLTIANTTIGLDSSTNEGTTSASFILGGNTVLNTVGGSAIHLKLNEYAGRNYLGTGEVRFGIYGSGNVGNFSNVQVGNGTSSTAKTVFAVHGSGSQIDISGSFQINGKADNLGLAKLELVADNDGISTINTGSGSSFAFNGLLTLDFSDITLDMDNERIVLISSARGDQNLKTALESRWFNFSAGTFNSDYVSVITADAEDEFRFAFEGANGAYEFVIYYTHVVPEPATYAAIFGALALAFAAYRRRK